MKQYITKTLCSVLLLLVGVNAFADEVTFSYSDYRGEGTQSTGSAYTMSKDYVSIADSKFYCGSSATYAQFYASGTTTITPLNSSTITKVVLTATSTSYNGYQSSGTVTASTGTVTGSASSTTITWEGSATSAFTISHSKQVRWTTIVVTYSTGGGSTPTALSSPTNLSSSSVTYNSATLSWDAVENASSYKVKIGDTEYDASTNSYDATDLTASTEYTWTVKAIGDGTNYSSSDYAADATFTTSEAAKYSVTIETPENGTLTVQNNGADVTSGSTFANGEVISITATPADGYKFRNLQVVDASTHTYTASNTKSWTIADHDITIKANFDELSYYTINYSVNGSVVSAQENVAEGTALSFPEVSSINDKVFRGWVTTSTVSSTEEPTYVSTSGLTASEDVTYYAVFATESAGSGATTYILDNSTISAQYIGSGTDVTSTYADRSIGEWTGHFNINTSSDKVVTGIGLTTQTDNSKANYNSHLVTPTCSSAITSIEIKGYIQSTAARKIYLCSEDLNGNASATDAVYGSADIAAGDANRTFDVTISVTGAPTQMYIYAGTGALIITDIIVTCGSDKTYSDYCTIVTTKQTPTITVDDLEMYVGETMTVEATTDPTELDLTCSVTEGTDAVSLSSDNVLSANAVGIATVKAAFAGNTQYYASEASFGVIVKARYDLTDDEQNVEVLGPRVTDDIVTGAKEFFGTDKWTDNTLVYVVNDKNYTTTTPNVIYGGEGNYTCKSLVIKDKVNFTNSYDFQAESASYEGRGATSNYGTICLPYKVTSEDSHVAYYDLKSHTSTTLTFGEITTLAANTPALFYAPESMSPVPVKNANNMIDVPATPSAEMAQNVDEHLKMVGVFRTASVVNSDDVEADYDKIVDAQSYYIKNNKFCPINTLFILYPFRAYISDSSTTLAKALNISFEGMDDTDGVTVVKSEDGKTVQMIFDLNGRRLTTPQRGVNIIDGKKVMMK